MEAKPEVTDFRRILAASKSRLRSVRESLYRALCARASAHLGAPPERFRGAAETQQASRSPADMPPPA
jgi:hypothetical protein